MKSRTRNARTRLASGRLLSLVAAVLTACQPVGGGPAPAEPVAFTDPVLERGARAPGQEVRAAELYAEAVSAFEAGNPGLARRRADEVVTDFPRAPVSGLALLLRARAALAEGDFSAADEDAGRFSALLSPGDPRRGEVRLLQADARGGAGDAAGRLARLLDIGADATPPVVARAEEAGRQAAAELPLDTLAATLVATSDGSTRGPVWAVATTRYALLLQDAGREEEARTAAAAALEGGASGTDSLAAEAVLEGRNPLARPPLPVLSIATVLPTGGSPGFRDFAALVGEGIEVAAATVLEGEAQVEVTAHDDRGDPGVAAAIVAELERTDVLGVLGFLEEGALQAAAQVRSGSLPLVSPTARVATEPGAYALEGADPQGAAALARYATEAGYRRVAVIHSLAPESVEEAEAFTNALATSGVALAGVFSYPVGTTSFRDQILAAKNALRAAEIRALRLGPDDTLHVEMLEPVALFAPVPPEDVELLAPQIIFHGLDTLAIATLGTEGWTDPQTLEIVDDRHTTGVVATAPVGVGPGSPGAERFRLAYESHFRRTLVSPVPSLGYDAALFLLEAARSGARTPDQLRASLDRLRDVEGVNGTYSVLAGRVQRRTHLVRIEHGSLIPLG